jgi:hypothetical protein
MHWHPGLASVDPFRTPSFAPRHLVEIGMDRAFFPPAPLASRALRVYGACTAVLVAFPVRLPARHAMGGKLPASALMLMTRG